MADRAASRIRISIAVSVQGRELFWARQNRLSPRTRALAMMIWLVVVVVVDVVVVAVVVVVAGVVVVDDDVVVVVITEVTILFAEVVSSVVRVVVGYKLSAAC